MCCLSLSRVYSPHPSPPALSYRLPHHRLPCNAHLLQKNQTIIETYLPSHNNVTIVTPPLCPFAYPLDVTNNTMFHVGTLSCDRVTFIG